MNELVRVVPRIWNGEKVNTVNARDLHEFMGSGKQFSDWIKERIEKYDFIERQDFFTNQCKTPNGRPLQEYFITLDMAKQLSMVENTDKGKKARLYFIQCEKQLMDKTNNIPNNFAEALKLAYEQQLEIENKSKQLELQKPAVEYYEAVTDSRDALPVGDVAKLLHDNHQITMGRNEMFEFLRDNKVLMEDNKPYQKYVDCAYFRIVQQKYDVNGETKINIKTLVFQKGIDYILKLIKQQIT